jgi:hypothetical protein
MSTLGITMGDGRTWELPRPFLRLGPRPDGAEEGPLCSDDPELRALRAAVTAAADGEQFLAIAALAARLLRQRHVLFDLELSRILTFTPGMDWPGKVLDLVDGATGERTWERWRYLTVLAHAALPPLILLEDATDLADFFEFTKRTVPRSKWAIESRLAAAAAVNEAYI